MTAEVVEAFRERPPAIMVDATVGGGGHAEALLELGVGSEQYIGIDRDPEALAAAGRRLARFGERVVLVHRAFSRLHEVLAEQGLSAVDGLLLDLGVSSHQLDQARRGFGFRSEGPLDMRMDPTGGETVAELLDRIEARDLAKILKEFGEVPGAWRLANRILEAYQNEEVRSTRDLAEIVMAAAPQALRRRKVHPATLVFQAIRIAVNDELGEVDRVLGMIPESLAVGGTAAVISFHSLEDRRVKWAFRRYAGRVRDALPQTLGPAPDPDFVEVTRKPLCPTEEEIKRNPRARSAKLRVLRRVAAGGGGVE